MDVSVWWVIAAASIGMCVGMVLFAVLSMAADREDEGYPEPSAPTQTMV